MGQSRGEVRKLYAVQVLPFRKQPSRYKRVVIRMQDPIYFKMTEPILDAERQSGTNRNFPV